MLNRDITTYSSIFSKDYSELRVQENRSINIDGPIDLIIAKEMMKKNEKK